MNGARIEYFFIIFFILFDINSAKCPEKCLCKKVESNLLRVVCLGTPTNKIITIKELDLNDIAPDIQHL